MMTIILGMRATEVCTRKVRDVDDHIDEDGQLRENGLLWTESKTAAGRRKIVIPNFLALFISVLVNRKEPGTPLFPTTRSKSGFHDRGWVRAQVKRICGLADVPEVCAHGMRGTAATLAEDYGMASIAVSKSLGHESVSTTQRSYSQSDKPRRAKQQRVLKVLNGGKSEVKPERQ